MRKEKIYHVYNFDLEFDQVMRDGMIVQSGKYNDLLKPGTDLATLVIAHNESMQLVETEKPADIDEPVSSREVCCRTG